MTPNSRSWCANRTALHPDDYFTTKESLHSPSQKENLHPPPLLSGYQDSNLGPPAPKAGALTGLRYIPKLTTLADSWGKDTLFFLLRKVFVQFFSEVCHPIILQG